jgi:UDP-N-acetyl-D-galactosamine dehydrogenase
VDVYDPWVDAEEACHEYGLKPVPSLEPGRYDAIVLAVAHDQFKAMGAAAIRRLGKPQCVVFDVKHVLPKSCATGRL